MNAHEIFLEMPIRYFYKRMSQKLTFLILASTSCQVLQFLSKKFIFCLVYNYHWSLNSIYNETRSKSLYKISDKVFGQRMLSLLTKKHNFGIYHLKNIYHVRQKARDRKNNAAFKSIYVFIFQMWYEKMCD